MPENTKKLANQNGMLFIVLNIWGEVLMFSKIKIEVYLVSGSLDS
jgi:hypothetical protein